MRLSENRVLRGIFGPRRKKVTGIWRALLKMHLYYFYSSSNIICGDRNKKNEMSRACSKCGGEERYIQNFDGRNLRERFHSEDR